MPEPLTYLEWLWQHLRARSLRFWADIDYRRWPSPITFPQYIQHFLPAA